MHSLHSSTCTLFIMHHADFSLKNPRSKFISVCLTTHFLKGAYFNPNMNLAYIWLMIEVEWVMGNQQTKQEKPYATICGFFVLLYHVVATLTNKFSRIQTSQNIYLLISDML